MSGKLLAVFLLLLLLAGLPLAHAQGARKDGKDYHLTLLAVSDEGNKGKGITADMFVKVAPGNGRVFIEAEPITRLDTRISTKLAKEIACERLEVVSEKCAAHDFFFRIDANASLIGGPSAGAAAAALAIAAIDDAAIDQSVAVTGTINSGGLIGEVGGLKEKIQAAAGQGISTVLIPTGERYVRLQNSTASVDLVEYGESLGINVVEVSDISDVLFYLTGKNYSVEAKSLEIDKRYVQIMDGLSEDICKRSGMLSSQVSESDLALISQVQAQSVTFARGEAEGLPEAAKVLEAARNLSAEGAKERQKGSHYSGASFCFGANVRYSYLSLLKENVSAPEASKQIASALALIDEFEKAIPNANTLSSLQVRGTVKDRLDEARRLLRQGSDELVKGSLGSALYQLAYAKERLDSAKAWNKFMSQNGQQAPLYRDNSEALREGCTTRLQEAEEHMQYLEIYVPGAIKTTELGPVYSYLRNSDYSSCIFSASLAKAKANALLSAISAGSDFNGLVDRKLRAAKESIARQTAKGNFPIVSYSYYEYASTLKSTDNASALLFSEYALELSSLEVYLNGAAVHPSAIPRAGFLSALATGFGGGIASVLIALVVRKALKRKRPVLVVKASRRKKA